MTAPEFKGARPVDSNLKYWPVVGLVPDGENLVFVEQIPLFGSPRPTELKVVPPAPPIQSPWPPPSKPPR